MNIYMAGPIFTYGDFLRNTEWAKKIREAFPSVNLYSPIENTDINGVEGKKKFAGSQEIANGDNIRLNNTDILIACIDGDVLPSGTCAEIGKFHEKIERGEHKYIVGICTDNRQCALTHSEAKDAGGAASLGEQQYSYQNLYVTGLIKQGGVLVSNIDEAIAFIAAIASEFYPIEERKTVNVTKEEESKYEACVNCDKVNKCIEIAVRGGSYPCKHFGAIDEIVEEEMEKLSRDPFGTFCNLLFNGGKFE